MERLFVAAHSSADQNCLSLVERVVKAGPLASRLMMGVVAAAPFFQLACSEEASRLGQGVRVEVESIHCVLHSS